MIDPRYRARLLDEHSLEIDEDGGWLHLYLRPGRQRGMALLCLLLGAGFTGIALWLPGQELVSTAVRIASGCFGACLLLLAFYLPFNAVDVRIDRRRLVRVRSWFGLAVRRLEIAPAELTGIEIDQGHTASVGRTGSLSYQLVGRGRFGRVKLVESIPDRALVETIRQHALLAAGLKPSSTH